MVRKLVIAVAAASAVMSSGMVHALGVGDIHLNSALNQPLDAEIDLTQVRDLSGDEIRSMLASPDDFGRAGIDRTFFLTDLKFQPVIKPNGRSVIRVTSSRPVNEPFLNFLMEVRWPSGRVLREFTILLDPPMYQPTPVVSSSTISAPVSSSAPQVAAARPSAAGLASAAAVSAPPASASSPTAAAPAPAASSGTRTGQLTTTRSDTLWDLALRARPQGASVHQTMLAIQDLNPNAFINGNINQLKAGQTLTLPSAQQATARSNSEAIAEVAAQNSAWRNRRAPTAAQAQAPQLDARERQSAGAAPEAVDAQDSLRLVSGTEGMAAEAAGSSNADAGGAQLRDALDRTKEQLDAAEREKAEMTDRLNDVQGQLETLQRLLELKDAQLAALQQQVADAGAEPAVTAEEAAELADVAEAEADAAADVESSVMVAEPEAASEATSEEQAAEDVAADEQAPAETEASEPAVEEPVVAEQAPEPVAEPESVVPAEPAPVAEPADSDPMAVIKGLMQNQMLMIGGGVVAVLLLLLVLMSISRRNARREEAMADNFIADAAEQDGDQLTDSDDFNVALAGAEGMDGADELDLAADPLVEADALMAYGKLQEARDVLVAAVAADPAREELRLKLMEVNGLLEDSAGYLEQRAAVTAQNPSSARVAELDARFPLMAAAAAGAAAAAAQWDETDLADLDPSAAGQNDQADVDADMDFDFSEFDLGDASDTTPSAELAFDEPVAEPEPAAPAAEGFDLDFDLEDGSAQPVAQEEEPTASAPFEPELPDSQVDSINFDEFELDVDDLALPADEAEPAADSSTPSLEADFDLAMTDDLQAEDLMADFAALSDEPVEEPASTVAAEPLDLSADADIKLEDDAIEFELPEDVALPEDIEVPADTELSLDDFELPEMDEVAPAVVEAEAALATESDEEDDEFDFLSGTDECATKLDLARAYIDMGDQEGARDILNEVIEEGNDQQKQEAQSMMEHLAD
ncbi:peptigoglycan-binding protein LysM [Pseudomonas aestusnigri]|uniref:FimV/HubP family polar landmark protein n=1 Tax=Halopseudomonas aestusnigri TaxID=857252 RepID=UPI001D19790B|nr:FimV/HubP family polar landmark protein [Halopseudomonas aestusnigri]MCC4261069.1 peptigoglycan-binding protein LysM [Halopseudomonas aestusnigri]